MLNSNFIFKSNFWNKGDFPDCRRLKFGFEGFDAFTKTKRLILDSSFFWNFPDYRKLQLAKHENEKRNFNSDNKFGLENDTRLL